MESVRVLKKLFTAFCNLDSLLATHRARRRWLLFNEIRIVKSYSEDKAVNCMFWVSQNILISASKTP